MRYLVVFVVGFVLGGWAVPLGFVFDMGAPTVFMVAAGGGLFGCWLFLLAGGRIERYVRSRRRLRGHVDPETDETDETDEVDPGGGRVGRLVDRYGARGLGLVGPIVPGVTASVVGGLALGLDRRELGKWLSIGIIVMYGLYTAAVALLISIW